MGSSRHHSVCLPVYNLERVSVVVVRLLSVPNKKRFQGGSLTAPMDDMKFW